MTAARLPAAVRDLLRPPAADADLLARFVARRDEAAFAELVRRHGGPVWDVCRSVLRNAADADDAFQATFLTLARRAAHLRKPASVGAWLHGVAVRVARKARAAAARRRLREAAYEPAPAADPGECDVRAVVHEALAALPASYHEPLVACYLRGLSHDATAAELGLTPAAVKKRLERGRDRLRAALRSRGLAPTLVLAAAAVPDHLLAAATRLAGGAAVPPAVLILVEGGLSMTFAKFTAALVLAAGVGLAVAGQEREPRTLNVPPPPTGTSDKASPAAKLPAPAAKAELEGVWTVSLIETDGAPVYDGKTRDETLPTPTFTFDREMCRVSGVRVLYLADFRYKTDAAKTPKEIDATLFDGPKKGTTVLGIYQVRGDELRMCLRLQRPDLGRPKGYVTNSGTTLYTFVLTRSKLLAGPASDLRFDDVLRSGNKLYLVMNGPLSKSFPDDLAPFAERLDLAVKTADRLKEKDLTVVLFRRFDPKAPDGMWTGFTRDQLGRYAAEEQPRRIDKLAEHAWTAGRLPKDAVPLPPAPPQPKAAPPQPAPREEVGIYDRVHTTADLPVPGTQVTSPKDRQRVYFVTNTLRMWGEPRNAGKHPGLYASRDAGKTWKLVNASFEFKTLFVHPTTGDLFAVIEHAWNGTDEKDGRLTRFHADKAVHSTDGGTKWKDITPPPGYIADITSFFADPDHAGRACFVANVVRDVIYRPKDDRYSEYDHIRAASVEGERLMVRAGAPGEERR